MIVVAREPCHPCALRAAAKSWDQRIGSGAASPVGSETDAPATIIAVGGHHLRSLQAEMSASHTWQDREEHPNLRM